MQTIKCVLKQDKEKAVLGRHPWIFSGAIDQIEEGYTAGDWVHVYSSKEIFLGVGLLNPKSQIAVRMISYKEEPIDEAFFRGRIQSALSLRRDFLSSETNAYRLIHSESDFLPGVTADRYADYAVLQIQSAGMEPWKKTVAEILMKEAGLRGVFEKGESEWRTMEGLAPVSGVLAGEAPPEKIQILENGVPFYVDIRGGQKTGFFLDQRDNRKLVGLHAQGKRILNCFSYTGGFSVAAAKGGAVSTVSVDSSESALSMAGENFKLNGMDSQTHRLLHTDVFQYLRQAKEEFDLIVLDPPSFCQNKNHLEKALRAYKDINLLAMKRLRPRGILFTASCSSFVSQQLFRKILFGAAKDAACNLQVLTQTGHAADHPVSIYFPEGEYLKGVLCRVTD